MVAARGHFARLIAAGDFTDPKHERLIFLAVGGLALLGAVMVVITVVWWRGTRSEHPSLAPLEAMGRRGWQKAPPAERRRWLDELRPVGASSPTDPEPVRGPAQPVTEPDPHPSPADIEEASDPTAPVAAGMREDAAEHDVVVVEASDPAVHPSVDPAVVTDAQVVADAPLIEPDGVDATQSGAHPLVERVDPLPSVERSTT